MPIDIPAGRREEPLRGGAVVHSWEPLRGEIEVGAELVEEGVWRIAVRVVNTTAWEGGDRADAMRRTFASTHVVLRVTDGAFVSLADPPERLRAAAQACDNRGSWPVLVGPPGERSTVLAAPIILEDHPRVSPESPGDLFDGAEIDELLILGVLSLTDSEKREMRAADPRTAAILDRCEGLSPDELLALHGTLRDPRGAW